MDEERLCDICGERPAIGVDEDETEWCVDCILAWEKRNGRCWATGELLKDKPWLEG